MVIEHSALAEDEGQSYGKRISLRAIPIEEEVVALPDRASEENVFTKTDPVTSTNENNHKRPVEDRPEQKLSNPKRLKLKENWEKDQVELKMLHEDSEELKTLFKDIQADIQNVETIIDQVIGRGTGRLIETGKSFDPVLEGNIKKVLPIELYPSVVGKLGPWFWNIEKLIDEIKDSILTHHQLLNFCVRDYEEYERINLYLSKMIDFLFRNEFIDHESNHFLAFKDQKIMNILGGSNSAYIIRKLKKKNLGLGNHNEEGHDSQSLHDLFQNMNEKDLDSLSFDFFTCQSHFIIFQ
ncbi:hypothetical protein Pst134EA_000930 [Puccinia striiformis f. sp. tritici]|uniref:hypothetical protein n=1 Tax=Puccinia striiformis f. sp. tritici TaxID=168172 RepID=UPI00200751C3|nr:hypothetical protein Pst134EA_000930 [Puccinia striiformis f. sp. tritici]KAH9473868.1 hypothetical protein Pst134EA_000930 [Puccinia striiformis f. sp. tritici]